MRSGNDVYVVTMVQREKREVIPLWTSVHITQRGAASAGVLEAIKVIAGDDKDEVGTEFLLGVPERAFVREAFEEIRDGGKGQVFEHEFDAHGTNYLVVVTRVELED